jgi:DNA polymerase elongation subunit (family B)
MDTPVPVGDFASLYPSSMISENLSHDTKVWSKEYNLEGVLIKEEGHKDPNNPDNYIYDNLENYNYVDIQFDTYKFVRKSTTSALIKTIYGYKITRYAQNKNGNKGILPNILKELLTARKVTKKLMEKESDDFMKKVYDKRQLAYKVTANSLYGQCGAKVSTFYEQDIAASTTAIGRMLLLYAKKIVEECYSNYSYKSPIYGELISNASYIYGDTDSVFFTFNLKRIDGSCLSDKENLSESIRLAQEATNLVSKFLKYPHNFEYEKTFMPFCILSKKRYVGMLYETDINKCKRKEQGIVLVRRDNAPIVKEVYGGIIDILMNEKNIEKAVIFLENCLTHILNGECSIDKLIISKSLNSSYKDPDRIAHKVLASRITEREPGNKPMSGDRIPFVYIVNNKKNCLQGEKIEVPSYILENNIPIDYSFYISNQIMKPVQQLFALVLETIWKIKKKTPKNIEMFNRMVNSSLLKINDEKKKIEKLEDLRNEEIKKLIFDKYLIKANNQRNGYNTIDNFFNKIKTK